MSTRTLIAAAALTMFAGAAAAEGESHIDYTNMYSTNTRAEVMAEARASNNMKSATTFTASEAYGRIDPQAMMSDTTREEVMAEAFEFRVDNNSSQYIAVNEAYNGVPGFDTTTQRSLINAGE